MQRHRILRASLVGSLSMFLLGGCASHYVTPGGPAPLMALASEGAQAADGAVADPAVAARMQVLPAAQWPAGVAFARVQARGYRSHGSSGVNRGSLALVGAGVLERDTDAAAIAGWPAVRGVARLSPILVPPSDDALGALREGAATLRADILALYTVDTDFRVDDRDIGPLGLLTLGLAPTRNAVVGSTASIAFFDVRTGFCYGAAEGSASDDQVASAWTSEQAVEDARLRAERMAFERMLEEAAKAWAGIAAEAARQAQAPVDAAASAAK
ncbi:MAG: hypothetical protein GC172_10965 [Phycisphaera sp.]|nr:hypothetical protein [Phycisphaera sp.]